MRPGREQVLPAAGCERTDRFPAQIDRIEIAFSHAEQAVIRAAFPEVHAACTRGIHLVRHLGRRFLAPDHFARRTVERLNQPGDVGRIQHAPDHRRRGEQVVVRPQLRELFLQFWIESGAAPCNPQVLDVVAGDLRERRVPLVGRVAA